MNVRRTFRMREHLRGATVVVAGNALGMNTMRAIKAVRKARTNTIKDNRRAFLDLVTWSNLTIQGIMAPCWPID